MKSLTDSEGALKADNSSERSVPIFSYISFLGAIASFRLCFSRYTSIQFKYCLLLQQALVLKESLMLKLQPLGIKQIINLNTSIMFFALTMTPPIKALLWQNMF